MTRDTVRPPRLEVPHQIRAAPEGASVEQIMFALQEGFAAYANIAARAVYALDRELPDLRAWLIVVDARSIRNETDMTALKSRLDAIEATGTPSTREHSASSHDLARFAAEGAVADVKAYETNPSTPPGPPDEATLGTIFEQRVQAVLAIRDAARLRKELAAKQAKEAADLNVARTIRLRTWLAVIAVAVMAAHETILWISSNLHH